MTEGFFHGKDVLSLGGGVGVCVPQLTLCSPPFLQKLLENVAFSVPIRVCMDLPPASFPRAPGQSKQRYFIIGSPHSLVTENSAAAEIAVCVCVCVSGLFLTSAHWDLIVLAELDAFMFI